MAIINEKILRKIIREEIQRLFEDPNLVGLQTSKVYNTIDGERHHASSDSSYTVEYFDSKMGTKQLGGYRMASLAKQNALEFYKREKEANHLGTVTDYIGVSSDTGNEFWIFYINKFYLDGINKNVFNTKQAYKNWMKVALNVMRSGEPAGGKYNLKEIDYTQPSRLDYPSGLANTSGVTNTQDIVKAKSDFTDRNFPPNVQFKKTGSYYVFYGETYNLRDIFDLMKHHTLIPFQLKVINNQEFWITKSKNSAQKAKEMINKRYNKKIV